MSWKKTAELMETIRHYANFPATGVSLRQMVQFGEKPSVGMDCCSLAFARDMHHVANLVHRGCHRHTV